MEDLHDTWGHRWISKKLSPGKSKIHGTGMIANEKIVKGEVVAVYGGVIVPSSDIVDYRKRVGGIRGIQIDENFFIYATERKGGLFNHSCDPSLGYKNTILIVALKDKNPGEELAFDYSFTESDFEPWECSCGSENCRKVIRPDDWKNKELQEKWGEYFAPYLKKKFI